MNLRQRLANALFGDIIRTTLAETVKVIDDRYWTPVTTAGATYLDLPWAEHRQNLDDCLSEWRTNPLAFRVTHLMSDFVIGSGMAVKSKDAAIQAFIEAFWNHPQNRIAERLTRWCDELTRTGELFLVLSRNPADRMSYVREMPALLIDKIETDPNDRERELHYHETTGDPEGRWWLSEQHPDAAQSDQVMLHFAVNRPAGATRGTPDLLPILRWLRRYQDWVEDRARLNKYRATFLWHCTISNPAPGELERKRAQYAKSPTPGSILISDQNEAWEAKNPQINADEAESDGKALRLMVAAGAGIPLHFLGEGESATKATAAEMGQPTYKHYKSRQVFFAQMILTLVESAIRRALVVAPTGQGADLGLTYELEEVTREDTETLASSAAQIVGALAMMRNYQWIDDETAARLALKFAGELLTPAQVRDIMRRARTPAIVGQASSPPNGGPLTPSATKEPQ
jgi:hypothetical protein